MPRLASFLVVLLPLLLSAVRAAAHSNGGFGFKATLRHVDANGGYTEAQLLARAVQRSRARVAALQSLATSLPANVITTARILVRASEGEYLMDMGIGTPPRYYSAILDTGSDLIWTQCAPCLLCVDQPTPYFDPTQSPTYVRLTCSSPMCNALYYPLCFQKVCVYQYFYGDSASTAGVLANETFTFGTNTTRVTVPSISFGCGSINSGALANSSGMVGFGRGSLSLVSQLGSPRFSYCLTSFLSPTPSRFYFGVYATLNSSNTSTSGPVQSTPFVVNPALPTMYFLNMTGISVGGDLLGIDPSVFAINDADGTGGVIIDSGTTITYLAQPAYDTVRAAFVSQIKLPLLNVTDASVLDTCFNWPPPPRQSVTLPEVVFHFDGADMVLPLPNYMYSDTSTGALCLAMAPSVDGSIIGNFQHQNFHVLYDLENSLLSFVPAPCNLT
ncbi:aspartic proteinase nepenthesin-1-like [Phragmites australis]|uniref:aspartic proteinase nepenthesin-1-like n=1 Tax=Phragmites australis TaxID=29695 RepID=UPI002D777B23|nr:aspartic proteinase nepenthesin-1-like [Phragmites australis]